MAIKALNYFPFGDCAYGFCFLHRMEFNKIQNWNSSTGKKNIGCFLDTKVNKFLNRSCFADSDKQKLPFYFQIVVVYIMKIQPINKKNHLLFRQHL